jgi:hypothetical protein
MVSTACESLVRSMGIRIELVSVLSKDSGLYLARRGKLELGMV